MLTSLDGLQFRRARPAVGLVFLALSVPLACRGTSDDDGAGAAMNGTGGGPSGTGGSPAAGSGGSGGGSGGSSSACRANSPSDIGCPTYFCVAWAQVHCQEESSYDLFAKDSCGADGNGRRRIRITFSDGASEIACDYDEGGGGLVGARGKAATAIYCNGTSDEISWGEELTGECGSAPLAPCMPPGDIGGGGAAPVLPPASCYDGWGGCDTCCPTFTLQPSGTGVGGGSLAPGDCSEAPFNLPGYSCTDGGCSWVCNPETGEWTSFC